MINKFWRLHLVWKEVLPKDSDLINTEILFVYTLNSGFRFMQSTEKYFQEESKPFLRKILFQLSISRLNIPKFHFILNHVCSLVKQMFYFGILRWLKTGNWNGGEVEIKKWDRKLFCFLFLLYYCHSNMKLSFGRNKLGNIN